MSDEKKYDVPAGSLCNHVWRTWGECHDGRTSTFQMCERCLMTLANDLVPNDHVAAEYESRD